MRQIKLTGREASVVRAIGFTESMLGTEIQDMSRHGIGRHDRYVERPDRGRFCSNAFLIREEVDMAEVTVTAFEVNPAYVHELREAMLRR